MATVRSGDELFFTVRLNGSLAMQDMKKIEGSATQSFRAFTKVAAASIGFFYGGIARQAAQEFGKLGDLMGRGSPLGANAAQFYGRIGAANTAADRTVEAFGLAGAKADKEQILAAYNVFREIERLRADSKSNVQATIGEQRTQEVMTAVVKDLMFAIQNLNSVIKELGRVMVKY
jgi:hypothetical protein